MPTLFQVGAFRIVVYLNDHSPPHVHAIGAGGHAKFELGRTPDDVILVETVGLSKTSLRRIAAAIVDRHGECRAGWRKHHGN
jgi:Domain of unknown function (DUF4160)